MVGCLVGSLVVRKDDHHEYTPALSVGVGVVNVYSLLLYRTLQLFILKQGITNLSQLKFTYTNQQQKKDIFQ